MTLEKLKLKLRNQRKNDQHLNHFVKNNVVLLLTILSKTQTFLSKN